MTSCHHIAFAIILALFQISNGALSADARMVRVATFNVLNGVGTVGTAEHNAVKDILARVNADIIAFQELQSSDRANWDAMAAALEYPHTAFSDSTPLAGNIFTGYFSRYPLTNQFNVISPSGANEITRPPFRVVALIPDAASPLALWVLHHKAVFDAPNQFRRAVEAIRCIQDINAYLAANSTHDEYVVLGDMNDDVSSYQAAFFNSLPYGLPTSYRLGADITFPVPYATFPRDAYGKAGSGMRMLDAFQTGTSNPGTFISNNSRIDYIFVSSNIWNSPLGLPVAETYNSNFDYRANGLPKSGSPLPATTSGTASDHYLVFADIHLRDGGSMQVSPLTGPVYTGAVGGPFEPETAMYFLTNSSISNLAWRIETPSWLEADPESGILEAGESTSITIRTSSTASNLAASVYSAPIQFVEVDSGRIITRTARLAILPTATLTITAVSPITFYGPQGGAYAPASVALVVSNAGITALDWNSDGGNYVIVTPPSGVLASQTTTQLNLSISTTATNLEAGVISSPVAFNNLVNGQGTTNVSVNIITFDNDGLFADPDAVEAGWQASGLWHITDTRTTSCARAKSGNKAWWYGQAPTCTYETGVSNSGSLISPEFIVPDRGHLTYWSWEETEDQGLLYDKRVVEISTNSGASWALIYQSGTSIARWEPVTISLANYAGKTARLQFTFDTVDNISNSFRGWLIDDIRVASPGTLATEPGLVRFEGNRGGPFSPAFVSLAVTNSAIMPVTWRATNYSPWLTSSTNHGFLEPLASTNIMVSLASSSANLAPGLYTTTIQFNNSMGGQDAFIIPAELLVRDQLPDDWRLNYFGHIDPRENALSREQDDPDLDGFTNADEYIADTDPLDHISNFGGIPVIMYSPPDGSGDDGLLQIELLNTKPTRRYDVLWSQDLHDANQWEPMNINVPGNDHTLRIILPPDPNVIFYRGVVKLPEP